MVCYASCICRLPGIIIGSGQRTSRVSCQRHRNASVIGEFLILPQFIPHLHDCNQ